MSAESYVELAFEAEASGVPLDEDAQAAAERFDQRHLDYASKARHQLIETAMSPCDLIYSRGLINDSYTGRNSSRSGVPEHHTGDQSEGGSRSGRNGLYPHLYGRTVCITTVSSSTQRQQYSPPTHLPLTPLPFPSQAISSRRLMRCVTCLS